MPKWSEFLHLISPGGSRWVHKRDERGVGSIAQKGKQSAGGPGRVAVFVFLPLTPIELDDPAWS
jgi:hypothetical protein